MDFSRFYTPGNVGLTHEFQTNSPGSPYLDIFVANETIVEGIQIAFDLSQFGYNVTSIESGDYVEKLTFSSNISQDSSAVKIVVYDTGDDYIKENKRGTLARINLINFSLINHLLCWW